jgi:hypothetical protein
MTGPFEGGMGAGGAATHAVASGGFGKPPNTRPRYTGASGSGKGKRSAMCHRADGGPSFTVTGQTATASVALHAAASAGVTALEVSTWAYRFAAYCHELRKKGLEIETVREPHEGGWHGRHVLHTLVRLEPVPD